MSEKVVTRFPPSPTGFLHVGGVRTALFNWLYARHFGGKFILRIEDTDRERSKQEYAESLIDALKWLGLNWDEGPIYQSDRLAVYNEKIDQLIKSGHAYYCFCTPEELEAEKDRRKAAGLPPVYSKKCDTIPPDEAAQRVAAGETATVRFRVPDLKKIVIDDLVRGKVEYDTSTIGDFIIRKSDGFPSYNFAVVIDDSEMGITHIIRGNEHLSNTPRQILLYMALNLELPKFAHVSIILDEHRLKLSKRDNRSNLNSYREQGYLPEGLTNYLALLGWSPKKEKEFLNRNELISLFDIDGCAKSDAVFDIGKLDWLNGMYIRSMDVAALTDLVIPYFKRSGIDTEQFDRSWLEKLIEATRDYCIKLADFVFHTGIFINDINEWKDAHTLYSLISDEDMETLVNVAVSTINNAETLTSENAVEYLKKISAVTGIKGKAFFMSMRILLTGQQHGVELNHVLSLYGKEKSIRILQQALTKLKLK